MQRQGILGLLAAAILIAGCGGDDENDRTAEAQQVVNDTLVAYAEKDFDAMCELQDQRANDAIIEISKEDTCAEGYAEIFKNQSDFDLQGGTPFDDFVETLPEYKAGDVEFLEEGEMAAEVKLIGPEEASSFLRDEDGELKVSELFVTSEPNLPNEQ